MTGRQKAAEIKRRIIHACGEAGLTVQGAKYYIRHEYGDRLVQVAALHPGGSCRISAITICTTVDLGGNWSGCLQIACLITDDRQDSWMGPVFILQGRDCVPLHELADELRQTVEEREQVVAAMRMGVEGPYTFHRTVWHLHAAEI